MGKMAFSMYHPRPEAALILQETGRAVAGSGGMMKAKPARRDQGTFLYEDLIDQLNPKHPLLQLGKRIPWERFEQEFSPLYSEHGRPAKPIRLMIGLMILKQLENLSDERDIEAWGQNPYYQAFCGETHFQWKFPCDHSDFTYFRRRIGEDGARLIFEVSVGLHGDAATEREITVDTTVQEKNITFPTDVKLLTKVIKRCRAIADSEGIRAAAKLPQGTARSSPPAVQEPQDHQAHPDHGWRPDPGTGAQTSTVRAWHGTRMTFCSFAESTPKNGRTKTRSTACTNRTCLCIGKGKEHKKYEFGRKGIHRLSPRLQGVIEGAMSFKENVFDGHTLPDVLEQVWQITESCP